MAIRSSCGAHKNKAKRRPLAGNPKLGILNPKQDRWGEIPQFGGFVQIKVEIMKRLDVKKTEPVLPGQTLYVKKGWFVAWDPALVNRQTHHEQRTMYPAVILRPSLLL